MALTVWGPDLSDLAGLPYEPRSTAVGVIAGLLVAAVVIVAFVTYLIRAVIQPVRRTAAIAEQLADGRLEPRLMHTGLGEISRVGRNLNILGSSFGRSLDGLAQLVEAQTALRRVATLVARGVGPPYWRSRLPALL